MNTIINNRNYNFTKTFIEDNITAISSDQTKNMLISLYHALTPENAGKIYEVVAKLILNINVAMESQPAAFCSVTL